MRKLFVKFTTRSPGCLPILVIVLYPLLIAVLCAELIYVLGPFVCGAISSWRIAKLNHGNDKDGTDSVADMMAALNIFYALVIFQGAMFGVLHVTVHVVRRVVASRVHELEQLPDKWGRLAIYKYLYDISKQCRKDPLSTKGMDLIKYGAELLDSESLKDYLYGARLLSAFIAKGMGEDVRLLLLPSGHKIQKLIDSLWISSSPDEDTEIRELAAMIIADLAGHIVIAKYPGAMQYISSLFQENSMQSRSLTNQTYRNSKQVQVQSREVGTSNELILQGLTILEGLASNSNDNRRIIRGTPELLPKITAPVCSTTLVEDVQQTKAWADTVTRCLRVLYQLVRAPDGSHQIFEESGYDVVQAGNNLKSILLELGNDQADHLELQLVAMQILTDLALDSSANLTNEIKQVLIRKQLQLFLGNGDFAAMAGRTMVSLSANSETNSALIMTTENGIIGSLTGILDDENITRRTIAAEIMANLCPRCNVDNNMKEILLPMVLKKIMSIKGKPQEREISAVENNPAALEDDEENQGTPVSTNYEERHGTSWVLRLLRILGLTQQISEEFSDEEREEQEAFLSLAQVICDKLNGADLDGAIQNAVQIQNDKNAGSEEQQRRQAFVVKLKTIIDNNRHAEAYSLRIVKLCGRIAQSVMQQCEQYVEIFRNKGFKSSLCEASKTMSELESCMRFVGTDFGPKKTVTPFLEDLARDVANKL